MKFVSIDGVKTELMTLEALKAYLLEHTFFKFMDAGRSGVQHAGDDAIDNFSAWIQYRGAFGRGTMREELGSLERFKLRNAVLAVLVDGLITRGSAGVKDAIDRVYLMTLDALIETKDKT